MIHVVIGTKAQLIKMAPILKIFKEKKIPYNYISTGQHKATIDDILSNFEIKKPDFILYEGKDITSIISMFFWTIKILFFTLLNKKKIFKNDGNGKGIVLVHGDTMSTVLGAIMGKISGLKVAHIESGLRSFNIFQPFPEELNRLITFKLSDYMFCPGDWAVKNLEKYRRNKVKIDTKINTLYDSLRFALPEIEKIIDVDIPKKEYGIVTLHRFENFKSKVLAERIVDIVEDIARDKFVLFILHKPTKKNLLKYDLLKRFEENENIELRERYDYFRFIKLITKAKFLISDGGSNQEECYYLGKPVLLLRNVSERNEGLGRNAVISKFDDKIISEFINNIEKYEFDRVELADIESPSEKIINIVKDYV